MTFIVFPATTNDSYYNFMKGINNEVSWYFLFNSTVYNVFDTVGRKLAGYPKCFNMQSKTVIGISILRIIFLATFLLVDFNVAPKWLF